MKKFKSKKERDKHFRHLVNRTDRVARRHAGLRELDQRRILAGSISVGASMPLAGQPMRQQAGR